MAARMFTRRLITRPLNASLRSQTLRPINAHQLRNATSQSAPPEEEDRPQLTDEQDPGMNGGYVNPPRVKRQFRDPHANWWDKQERRNFGEPLHEDNDILGLFSPEEHTHFKPGFSFFLIGCFCVSVYALYTAVGFTYPDRPSVPRDFPDGLEAELGGPHARRARKEGDAIE